MTEENVKCPKCGTENIVNENNKFCKECGNVLVIECPHCRTVNTLKTKYCYNCKQYLKTENSKYNNDNSSKIQNNEQIQQKIECPHCGTENIIDKNNKFCKECGKDLTSKEATTKESFDIAKYGDILLTRDYVRQYIYQPGRQYSAHIFLRDISCVEVGFESYPAWLVLGIILLIAYGLGIILIIVYYVTRKHAIIITSNGNAKIKQLIKMGSSDEADDFVSKIIMAKKNILDLQTK